MQVCLPASAPAPVMLRPAAQDDLEWVRAAHATLYHEEFGWDSTFEGMVRAILDDFAGDHDPATERAWIAWRGAEPVGSVLCVAQDSTTAQLRLLLVEPSARGAGVGGMLVAECVAFARAAGYERMVLWTNDVLTDARRLYSAAGFTLVRSESHHSFGQDLVGEYWSKALR